jgi:hypothetical protein
MENVGRTLPLLLDHAQKCRGAPTEYQWAELEYPNPGKLTGQVEQKFIRKVINREYAPTAVLDHPCARLPGGARPSLR